MKEQIEKLKAAIESAKAAIAALAQANDVVAQHPNLRVIRSNLDNAVGVHVGGLERFVAELEAKARKAAEPRNTESGKPKTEH